MKIVVGVDGSEGSQRALGWCAKFAGALSAEVIVVHAHELPIFVTSSAPIPEPLVWSAEERDRMKQILNDEWCKQLADASVAFRSELIDGYPPKVLIDIATREDADLVVTGRRGLGGFKELLLGSTSNHLSHHLNRPLLIIP